MLIHILLTAFFVLIVLSATPFLLRIQSIVDAKTMTARIRIRLFYYVTVFDSAVKLNGLSLAVLTDKNQQSIVHLLQAVKKQIQHDNILSYISIKAFSILRLAAKVEYGILGDAFGFLYYGTAINVLMSSAYALNSKSKTVAELDLRFKPVQSDKIMVFADSIISLSIANIIIDILKNYVKQKQKKKV